MLLRRVCIHTDTSHEKVEPGMRRVNAFPENQGIGVSEFPICFANNLFNWRIRKRVNGFPENQGIGVSEFPVCFANNLFNRWIRKYGPKCHVTLQTEGHKILWTKKSRDLNTQYTHSQTQQCTVEPHSNAQLSNTAMHSWSAQQCTVDPHRKAQCTVDGHSHYL
jgi:hypothetical protein